MTALAKDLVAVAKLEYSEIELIMINKALTYGIIKHLYSGNEFLWDISKGLLYRISVDM